MAKLRVERTDSMYPVRIGVQRCTRLCTLDEATDFGLRILCACGFGLTPELLERAADSLDESDWSPRDAEYAAALRAAARAMRGESDAD